MPFPHRPRHARALLAAIGTTLACSSAALGQVWEGTIQLPTSELGIKLKLAEQADGWQGTLDVPDQQVVAAPLAGIVWNEQTVSFTVEIAGLPPQAQPRFQLTRNEEGDLAGTMQQGPMPLAVSLDRIEEVATFGRPQEPKGDLPYPSIDVTIPVMAANDEGEPELAHELAGTLTLPNPETHGEGPHPVAILLSGSGPQDRDEAIMGHRPFFVLSDRLTRAGIAVLRCDDRGTGLSGGVFNGSTMEERTEDAKAQLHWLSQRDDIDASSMGIIGHSEGGILAPMVAAEAEDDRVAFLVLLAAPTVTGGEIITAQSAEMGRRNGLDQELIDSTRANNERIFAVLRPDVDEAELLEVVTAVITDQAPDIPEQQRQAAITQFMGQLSDPWLRHFAAFDPATALSKVEEPVLVLFAETDVQVLPSQNLEPAQQALADNDDATIEVLDGLNHLFQPSETGLPEDYGTIDITFDEDAMAKIAAWINERFGN